MKYLTLTRHCAMPDALVVSRKFTGKLAREDRQIVGAAGQRDAQVEAASKTARLISLSSAGEGNPGLRGGGLQGALTG